MFFRVQDEGFDESPETGERGARLWWGSRRGTNNAYCICL